MCAVCACGGALAVKRQEVGFFLLLKGVTITTGLPAIFPLSVLLRRFPGYQHHV